MQILQSWLQSFIQNLTALFMTYLPRLVLAGTILVLGFGVAIVARRLVPWLLRRALPEVQLFAGRLTYVGALIGAILWALAVLNVHIAALATLMGTIGLAVSLSSQDVAKNFVAGLYLLIERPFHIGDQITVRTGTGRVEFIGLRTTILRTDDNKQVIVPNTVILSEVVVKQVDERPPGNQ
jgi:small-conductance mechanosensitive channel